MACVYVIYAEVIGLVEAEDLKPNDLVGVNKVSDRAWVLSMATFDWENHGVYLGLAFGKRKPQEKRENDTQLYHRWLHVCSIFNNRNRVMIPVG